ncbi:MAG: trimeric intracellular cation channel family protein [Clostridia bacterium]|nr:trimeric intracellular cation channel family protein [Clostridia bacterium]
MIITAILIHITELIGTVAFSVSGAIHAIGKKLDLLGVVVLGCLTALGGGVLRDLLLGQIPPRAFSNFAYLTLAALSALTVFVVAGFFQNGYRSHLALLEQVNNVFDAVGLGAFSVVGVQIAMEMGHNDNIFFCVFLGVTTGCGGGILRDLMCAKVPGVLTKHIYALASAAGGALYWGLCWLKVPELVSVLSGIGLVLVIRMLATVFRWSLPKLRELGDNT